MVVITRNRKRGLNVRLHAALYVAGAKIPGVRQRIRHLAQRLWQDLQFVQNRFYLLFVICRLSHMGAHDQHRIGIDAGLGVVALLKTATRDRHDARFLIGQIDLIFIFRAGLRWFRFPAFRLFFDVPQGLPFFLFALVFGVLLLKAFLSPLLNGGFRGDQGVQARSIFLLENTPVA